MFYAQHPEKEEEVPSWQEIKQTPVVMATIKGESLGPRLLSRASPASPASCEAPRTFPQVLKATCTSKLGPLTGSVRPGRELERGGVQHVLGKRLEHLAWFSTLQGARD